MKFKDIKVLQQRKNILKEKEYDVVGNEEEIIDELDSLSFYKDNLILAKLINKESELFKLCILPLNYSNLRQQIITRNSDKETKKVINYYKNLSRQKLCEFFNDDIRNFSNLATKSRNWYEEVVPLDTTHYAQLQQILTWTKMKAIETNDQNIELITTT
jgi:hypothetical protein